MLNGEFAKGEAATKSKYYTDKLKSVLAAKRHLNHLILSLPFISPSSLKALRIPIILVMGLNCHLFTLSLIDQNVYVVQKVHSFSYPRTYRQVSEGGIAKILDGFAIIEVSNIYTKKLCRTSYFI